MTNFQINKIIDDTNKKIKELVASKRIEFSGDISDPEIDVIWNDKNKTVDLISLTYIDDCKFLIVHENQIYCTSANNYMLVFDEGFLDFSSTVYSEQELDIVVEGGYIRANAFQDDDYPGIDVEFVPAGPQKNVLSFPRVLFEKSKDNDLRVLVWSDAQSEDYTDEIIFE